MRIEYSNYPNYLLETEKKLLDFQLYIVLLFLTVSKNDG